MKVITVIGIGHKKAGLLILLFCLFIFFFSRGVHSSRKHLISAELSAAGFPGQVTLTDRKTLGLVERQIAGARTAPGQDGIRGNYRLALVTKEGKRTLLFDEPAVLFDPRTGQRLFPGDGGACFARAFRELKAKNPYGEFITWSEADKIFRKYDTARVVDFATGMSFMVQRRAGSSHADVQPLTADDTAVMKLIYNGRWSWKRRAVIVELKERRLAGSMNGMPHGAGAISGNDFNGHFCIHFRESMTHSKENDLAHQIMVWKAAGKEEDMLAGAEPSYIIKVMLTALEQEDPELASRLFQPGPGLGEEEIAARLSSLKWIALSRLSELPSGKNKGRQTRRIEAVVSYGLTDGRLAVNRRVVFELIGNSGRISWKIDSRSIDNWLESAH